MVRQSLSMVYRLLNLILTQHNVFILGQFVYSIPVFTFVYSSIRNLIVYSFIMFVLSSNPSCNNKLSSIRLDMNYDQSHSYNTVYDQDNLIIRILTKCIKKHSLVLYCFHDINQYCQKDTILQTSQRSSYKSQPQMPKSTQIGTANDSHSQ